MDIDMGTEVKVSITISRQYTITTTPAAILAGIPGAKVADGVQVDDAADYAFALLAADTLQRDVWVTDIATREGDVDDESVEIEEVGLA